MINFGRFITSFCSRGLNAGNSNKRNETEGWIPDINCWKAAQGLAPPTIFFGD